MDVDMDIETDARDALLRPVPGGLRAWRLSVKPSERCAADHPFWALELRKYPRLPRREHNRFPISLNCREERGDVAYQRP